jgi:aminotransferase in exopolysaccharide biosynthesis
MKKNIIHFIQDYYKTKKFVGLHEPRFIGNEKKYLIDAVDSTFVSSIGQYVNKFEKDVCTFTKTNSALSVVNGTAAIQLSFYLSGVKNNDLVISPSLTFVAACNVLIHMGAEPLFVDVNKDTLGLCPIALELYLNENAVIEGNNCIHKLSKRRIRAIIPMHTFGHPVQMDEIIKISNKWNLSLIEDAAEAFGSKYKGKYCGTLSEMGCFSFNGNKTITTGGGGMVLFTNSEIAKRARHLSTTAKMPHAYEFFHDEAGFNLRMPNINAALGVAQLESINIYIKRKRNLAAQYKEFFKDTNYLFVDEPEYSESNFWLNSIICENIKSRNEFLKTTNDAEVMTRPVWELMSNLPAFKDCYKGDLSNSLWLRDRLVNIPSSVKV